MILKTLHDMVIGGQAVAQYGIPRFTQDIDVTIRLHPDDINKIIKKIESTFRILVKNPEDFVRGTWMLPIEHLKTKVRVDLIFSQTIFEQDAINNAKNIKIDNFKIKFMSPEDLIVQKVISGRKLDIEDAKSVLDVQSKKINMKYIENKLKLFSKELDNDEIYF